MVQNVRKGNNGERQSVVESFVLLYTFCRQLISVEKQSYLIKSLSASLSLLPTTDHLLKCSCCPNKCGLSTEEEEEKDGGTEMARKVRRDEETEEAAAALDLFLALGTSQ